MKSKRNRVRPRIKRPPRKRVVTRNGYLVDKIDDNLDRTSSINIVDPNGEIVCGTNMLNRRVAKAIFRQYPRVKMINRNKAKDDKVYVKNTMVLSCGRYQNANYFAGVVRPYQDNYTFFGYMNDSYFAIIPRRIPSMFIHTLNNRISTVLDMGDVIDIIRRDTSSTDVILAKYDSIIQIDPKDRNNSFTDDFTRISSICEYIFDHDDVKFRTVCPSLICERLHETLSRRYIAAHIGVYTNNGQVFCYNRSRNEDNPLIDEYEVKSFIPYAKDVSNLLHSWNARTMWTTLLTYSMSYPHTDDQKRIDNYYEFLEESRLLTC